MELGFIRGLIQWLRRLGSRKRQLLRLLQAALFQSNHQLEIDSLLKLRVQDGIGVFLVPQ